MLNRDAAYEEVSKLSGYLSSMSLAFEDELPDSLIDELLGSGFEVQSTVGSQAIYVDVKMLKPAESEEKALNKCINVASDLRIYPNVSKIEINRV